MYGLKLLLYSYLNDNFFHSYPKAYGICGLFASMCRLLSSIRPFGEEISANLRPSEGAKDGRSLAVAQNLKNPGVGGGGWVGSQPKPQTISPTQKMKNSPKFFQMINKYLDKPNDTLK